MDLAEKLDVSVEHLKRMETTHDRNNISLITLYKISIILGVRIDKFFEDDNTSFIKNEVMFGIKAEAGVAYNFNDVRVGLNFAYLPDLTRQTSFLNQTTRNNIFKLGISVGYIFR